MPKRLGFWDYIKAAFTLSPRVPGLGNLPVNYVGLATFAVLGLTSPAFWFAGAAIELAYLMTTASNQRFQNVVEGRDLYKARSAWQERKKDILARLAPGDCARYVALEERCRAIVESSGSIIQEAGASGPLGLSDFDQLLWIFLRLLTAKEMLSSESTNPQMRKEILDQLRKLDAQLKQPGVEEHLKKTYESTKGLLERRLSILDTADARLKNVEAELDRVEQQVAIIGQEAATALRDPNALSARIDALTQGLSDTGKMIKEIGVPLSEAQEAMEGPPSFLEIERTTDKTSG